MKLSYKDQLQDPRWKEKRSEILQRDNHTCTSCNSKENLHVHHKLYIAGNYAWEYSNEYLTTLCEDCHAKVHGRYVNPVDIKVNKNTKVLNPFLKNKLILALRRSSTKCIADDAIGIKTECNQKNGKVTMTYYMDAAPKTSLYTGENHRKHYMKLSGTALKMFLYIADLNRHNEDVIKINKNKFSKETNIESIHVINKGIQELIEHGFILAYPKNNYYWINSFMFFTGNRLVKYKDNVKIVD